MTTPKRRSILPALIFTCFCKMETEMKLSYIFARYFGLQNKPSSGAKNEK